MTVGSRGRAGPAGAMPGPAGDSALGHPASWAPSPSPVKLHFPFTNPMGCCCVRVPNAAREVIKESNNNNTNISIHIKVLQNLKEKKKNEASVCNVLKSI